MRSVSLGYSPCPNDTFIFFAMVHGKINTESLMFSEVLLDVEALNRKAFQAELDVTKISYHAFGHLRDRYCLLRSGSALGRGCGPLVISNGEYSMHDLRGKRIAIPGRFTTAYLLLQLCDPSFGMQHSAPGTLPDNIIVMPFDKILDALANKEVDAGLIIHESRFTYPSYGLKQIIDLGEWWEQETGLPIPLGGIIARRTLGKDVINQIDGLIKSSIEYSFKNHLEPMNYIKQHSQELTDEVIRQHIDLYVNNFSVDIGEEGTDAVNEFITRAERADIIPSSDLPIFSN